MSCSKKNDTSTPVTPLPPIPIPVITDYSFPINLLVDSVTLNFIKTDAVINPDMAAAVGSIITQPSLASLSKTPAVFVGVDADNFNNISGQAQDCKMLALRWLYTFQQNAVEAKPYFDKVQSTLLLWALSSNAATTHLPNETCYLGFYEAYSVIRSRLSAADRIVIDNWINAKVTVFRNFAPRVNNWETIRMNFLYYFGYLLRSTTILDYAAVAYSTLLDVNLMAGGKSEDYIGRDAFAYHAYNLSFFARIFRAKANFEGVEAMNTFKNRKNNINVTVQDMMNFWKPFLIDPSNNVHIEFVHTNYAPDKTRADYNKPYVPSSSVYALEELLLAFPESKGYIQSITGSATRYNRKVSGFLYWPR